VSFRTVTGLTLAAAALLTPAAHAGEIAKVCARPFGSAVPTSVQSWYCVGTGTQKPGCILASVQDPRGTYPLVGVDVCGVL